MSDGFASLTPPEIIFLLSLDDHDGSIGGGCPCGLDLEFACAVVALSDLLTRGRLSYQHGVRRTTVVDAQPVGEPSMARAWARVLRSDNAGNLERTIDDLVGRNCLETHGGAPASTECPLMLECGRSLRRGLCRESERRWLLVFRCVTIPIVHATAKQALRDHIRLTLAGVESGATEMALLPLALYLPSGAALLGVEDMIREEPVQRLAEQSPAAPAVRDAADIGPRGALQSGR